MSDTRILYTPRSDTTSDTEVAALAAVYAFILDCHAKKKAAEGSGGDDDGKGAKDDPATESILR